jgi:uncharacterized protein (DUF697 family)
MTKNEKVHGIIHTTATAAAAVGAGLAQLPGSDNAVITPMQIGMIIAIGEVHGHKLNKASALSVLSAATTGTIGRTIARALVSWIPGVGNAINAATALALTEAVGWAADAMLSEAA